MCVFNLKDVLNKMSKKDYEHGYKKYESKAEEFIKDEQKVEITRSKQESKEK